MYGLLFPPEMISNPRHFVEFKGTKLVMIYDKKVNVSISTTICNLAEITNVPIHTAFAHFLLMQQIK